MFLWVRVNVLTPVKFFVCFFCLKFKKAHIVDIFILYSLSVGFHEKNLIEINFR